MSKHDNTEQDNYQRALFREVSEDVEKEQFMRFWKKYGKKIAVTSSVVLLIVFSVLGVVLYKNWKIEQNAVIYAEAINQSLYKPQAAQKVFQNLIEQDFDGFALLSRIQIAAIELDQGQEAQGFATLKSIGADKTVAAPFRNLVNTILAYHLLDKAGTEKEIIELLEPLNKENSLWRGSAREILALVALKKSENARAIELLELNITDANLPDSFKIRAKEMLSVIK